MSGSRKAAFLDRDGVINVDYGYVCAWEKFTFLPGAAVALQALYRAGYQLVVVSNQSGIGRGFYTEHDLMTLNRAISAHMKDEFDTHITGFYHCPHHPTEALGLLRMVCECRKPAPGMILRAARELDLELSESLLVGDKSSDILAGRAAGVRRMFKVGDPLSLRHAAADAETVSALSEVPGRLTTLAT